MSNNSREAEAEADEIFERAVKSIETANTEAALTAVMWKFTAAAEEYEKEELYVKAASSYKHITELIEKLISITDESRTFKYYQALGGMYKLLAITYEKSKMYKKAANAHDKSEKAFEIFIDKSIKRSSTYEKSAQSFRNLANTANNNRGSLREMKKQIRLAMIFSTDAFEKQKGMHNMWHPKSHGCGASPKSKNSPKRCGGSPNKTRRNRKTRRA